MTPLPLFLCAEFLYSNRHRHESFDLRLQDLFHILHDLRNVNNHEQSYLDLIPRSSLPKTVELLNQSFVGKTEQRPE